MSGANILEIIGADGMPYATECAARLGSLAVTRVLAGDGDEAHPWTITHVPSGFGVNTGFASARAAENAMRRIAALVDFDWLAASLAGRARSEEVHVLVASIKALLIDCGGVPICIGGRPDTRDELARRLKAGRQ